MDSLFTTLSQWPLLFKSKTLPQEVKQEAKRRVLDSLGCFYGSYNSQPLQTLRSTLAQDVSGPCVLWGGNRSVPADLAAFINGAGVRALDFNDTYLSQEPCHPSDLISSLWAACELSRSKTQGEKLIEGIILGYEIMCRLCDSGSIRKRGWDHVTYLPIASAVACSYVLGLNPIQTKNAISLAVVAHNALRQTRVGTISDWKAACAAYAARAGLTSARLAKAGFTGPSDIFSGRHGFFAQVSGKLEFSMKNIGQPWMIMKTHVKYYPAEHHSQSAIEAAVELYPQIKGQKISKIEVECFDVGVDIIGSEKEKWAPETRETADHSLPYLVAISLAEGIVNLDQYKQRKYLNKNIRKLMNLIHIKRNSQFTKNYPGDMASTIRVFLKTGIKVEKTIRKPKGYAGRPLTKAELIQKFGSMAQKLISPASKTKLVNSIFSLDRVAKLSQLSKSMIIA